jgi:UDPglucose--hexose-1-phosphate uridylyltransferase
MSELRWNPLLGEWVITATHRQDRTFLPPEDFCPLCPTRPGGPPTEIAHADFDVVVFDNRFPSLQPHPPEPAVLGTELMPVRPAMGACEVVVYTPRHDQTLRDASLGRLRKLIAVWAHRTSELGARPEVACVFVFENKGETIGVTLRHPHGQIYAYPWIPPVIAREVASGEAHRFRTGGCLWCDLLAQERADGRRVIFETETWTATVPFFARWPYEIHLTPRRHIGFLSELVASERNGLAVVLKAVLAKYDRLFDFSLPYIMAIHQRPLGADASDAYHLHFEFYPPNRTATKLKYLAGSEAGAGAFISDTLPEETAARLRELEPTTVEAVRAER